MASQFSSYYPPRAADRLLPQWFERRIDRFGAALRRTFANSRLGTPSVLSLTGAQFLLCLLIPGYAYARLRQPAMGRVFLFSWAAAGVAAVVFLAHPLILGWAVGGLASAHASGIGYLILREREASRGFPDGFFPKVYIPLAVWFICAAAIYWPGWAHLDIVGRVEVAKVQEPSLPALEPELMR